MHNITFLLNRDNNIENIEFLRNLNIFKELEYLKLNLGFFIIAYFSSSIF